MTGAGPPAWSNGLLASSYVPLTDVEAPMAPRVLTALERARIAAYLAEVPDTAGALRLYVASGERSDARTIVAAVVRAEAGTPDAPPADPLAGIDADAAFAALVADWHVDTHAAIRDAERDLSREDEDWRLRLNRREADPEGLTWLDDEHFVPPNPPPLPRPTGPIVLGLLLVVTAIVFFAFGGELGLPATLSLFLGVSAIIGALVLFVMRLRDYRDEDDEGAIL
ncbi:MAG: hypothetical protein ACRDVG_15960 [Jatrophihabitantaceae bacterium]